MREGSVQVAPCQVDDKCGVRGVAAGATHVIYSNLVHELRRAHAGILGLVRDEVKARDTHAPDDKRFVMQRLVTQAGAAGVTQSGKPRLRLDDAGSNHSIRSYSGKHRTNLY